MAAIVEQMKALTTLIPSQQTDIGHLEQEQTKMETSNLLSNLRTAVTNDEFDGDEIEEEEEKTEE